MKLADLLVDAWVTVPLEAETLEEALREILQRVFRAGVLSEEEALRLADALASGEAGELHPVNDRVVAILGTVPALEGLSVAVGVVDGAFEIRRVRDGSPATAKALVVVLGPGPVEKARKELIPEIVRVLKDPGRTDRLLSVASVADLRSFRELMDVELQTRSLVKDALLPVRYRVYPDTPLSEILDLMVRREIRAVPVVGEQYEVLGILTSGDALGWLLRRGRPEDEAAEGRGKVPRARDVMTRTVLCVSEDQGLVDAANMMVNRDVEQLPVVREGELVGFVTRDSILGELYGTPAESDTDQAYESDREP